MKELGNTILVVDDNPADQVHYQRLLEDIYNDEFDIKCVSSIKDAITFFSEGTPSLCLLDFNLPDGSALKILESFNDCVDQTPCPVVVITGHENTRTAVELMQNGVQDYLIKPIADGAELKRVIDHANKTWQLQRKMNWLALHDSLTGLVNRSLFIDRLIQYCNDSSRYDSSFALIYIDLDRFKYINDTFGHDAGDFLLKEFSRRITSQLRASDTAARLGGDEFAVILPNTGEAKAHLVASRLVNILSGSVEWHDKFLPISASIGLACYPSNAKSHQEIMREADFALYQSKRNGRGQYSAFNSRMQEQVQRRKRIAKAIASAIDNEELFVVFQPIAHADTLDVDEAEALVRWRYEGQDINPREIIDCIIEQKQIIPFHKWLFDTVCRKLKLWKAEQPELAVSINLPSIVFQDETVIHMLLEALRKHALKPCDLVVEIAESHFIEYAEKAEAHLLRLARSGIRIALDDFGAGFCSMRYLANIPCARVKIDKSFIRKLGGGTRHEKIVKGICSLAHNLGMSIVAEGVEHSLMLEKARELGCDKVQGFCLGAPYLGESGFYKFVKNSRHHGEKMLA